MLLLAALLLLLSLPANSFRAILTLRLRDGPVCFYQFLMLHDKYLFNIEPYGKQNFRATVSMKRGDAWEEILSKDHEIYQLQISKMAKQSVLHMFCVRNLHLVDLRVRITILMGVELTGMEALPNLTDQEQIMQTVNFLQKEKERLVELNGHFQAYTSRSQHNTSAMTTLIKQIIFVGLLLIILINLWFYYQTKRTFNQRKLI